MATSFLHSLPGFVRTVFRRVVFIVETPLMYLFGRDIFISYARSDAATYAQQLAIAVRGEVPKLSFFLDQWASLSGTTLPLSLRLALRWSQLLVFVGTQKAIDSAHVRMELQAFFNRKGRFVPIDVAGALGHAINNDTFLSAVCGPGAVHETGESVTGGTPSKSVVTRIVEAVTFTRQDRRLRRAVVAVTLGIAAIIGSAYFVSRKIISTANAQAQEAKRLAKDATDQRQQALKDLKEAQIATEQAKGERTRAEQLAKKASEEARLAETLRVEAEQLRDQARAEAARQSEIALVRQRANRSELMLQRNPTRLADSVSLAVESMNRAHATGIQSLEADRALRGSLSLMSRSLGPPTTIDDVIKVTALSPDGKYVATLSKPDSPGDESVLRIVKDGESREIDSFEKGWRFIALSNDARRVSISNGQIVQIREVSGPGRWEIKTENDDYVTGLALSPNGKYVALIMKNPDYETRGFAGVWEVDSGKSVVELQTDTLDMRAVAFSASGRVLAIAGRGYGPTGTPMGRAFVWKIRNPGVDGKLQQNHFYDRTELFQSEEIKAIAVGRDERFITTASGRLAVVWKKNPGGYHEIARVPTEHRIDDLAFDPDGKYLHVLSGGACEELTVDCRRRLLERWEANGYRQAVTVPHPDAIETISFQFGDQFITTSSTAYGGDDAHLWRTSDGEEVMYSKVALGQNVRHKSSPSDIRYTVKQTDDRWFVIDMLTGVQIPVATEGVEGMLDSPSLTPDANVLALAGKKEGESGFSVFIFKRGAESYVIDRAFPMTAYPGSLAISPDKSHVAVSMGVEHNRAFRVFHIKDGRDLNLTWFSKLAHVDSFEFAPDSKSLAVVFGVAKGKSVGVWRLRDGGQIGVLTKTRDVPNYTFNATGDRLAVAMDDETVELLDVRTGKTTVLQTSRPVELVTFSPDGRFLATADAKALVTLIELSTYDEAANFQHENKVSKIVFSRNGRYLATATRAESEDEAPPEEKYVLHVWLLRPEELVKEACERLVRFPERQSAYCSRR